MIEKEAVLSFLADEVVAKDRVVMASEETLNGFPQQCWGGEEWAAEVLKLTAAKAMKAAFEKTAEHVLALEES